ncbi:MAG: hypothetical protein NUV75_03110 [Gallionella sp.]|nr:hypothetical protein [Gallionella sp.]
MVKKFGIVVLAFLHSLVFGKGLLNSRCVGVTAVINRILPFALVNCFGLCNLLRLVPAHPFLNLVEQVMLKELFNLPRFGVHDAVQAEIEIGLIKLEEFT